MVLQQLTFVLLCFWALGCHSQEVCARSQVILGPGANLLGCYTYPGLLSVCAVQCPVSYQPFPNALSICDNGIYPPVFCTLRPSLLYRCERDANFTCPYDENEVLEYFQSNVLMERENLPASEIEETPDVTEAPPTFSPDDTARAFSPCGYFCRGSRRTGFQRPNICGTLRRQRSRVLCIRCRFSICRVSSLF